MSRSIVEYHSESTEVYDVLFKLIFSLNCLLILGCLFLTKSLLNPVQLVLILSIQTIVTPNDLKAANETSQSKF